MRSLAVAVTAVAALVGCSGEGPAAGGLSGAGASGGNAGSAGTSGSGGSAGSGAMAGTSSLDGAAGSSGGSGGTSSDGGTDASDAAPPPSVTGPAQRSNEGVLTNHPEFQFNVTGDIRMTSAYFLLMEVPNLTPTLLMWGDIENRGQDTRCILLADVVVGGHEILTVVDGPAYDVGSTVTSQCLPPGARGAFNSIEPDLPATILEDATSVQYSFRGLVLDPPAPRHPDEPAVLQPRIGAVTGGWGVTGRIQTRTSPVRNFGIRVYARDTSGLLFDNTSAYPGELEVLPTSTQMEFETYPVEHAIANPIDTPFAGFELYTSFIEGAEVAALEQGGERWVEQARREARVIAARQRLSVHRAAARR